MPIGPREGNECAGDLLDDPDIDLVVIATPNDTHFPLAKAALEAESMLWWISPLP